MDSALLNTIVSTSGAVIVAICGLWFHSVQIGKRIEGLERSLNQRIDDLRQDLRDLRGEFNAFRDVVNGKLSALDLEVGKIMDRLKLE